MMKRQTMVQIARIPTLTFLPLFLVGCPDDEATGTDNTGGGNTGGGNTGGGNTGGGNTGGGDVGGGFDGFLDDTFAAMLASCEAEIYCETGEFNSTDECLDELESYAYEYLADASQDCLDAYAGYLNCYAVALSCGYDEYDNYAVYSDANCDFEDAQIDANCY